MLPERNLAMRERQHLISTGCGATTQRASYRAMFGEATLVNVGGRYGGSDWIVMAVFHRIALRFKDGHRSHCTYRITIPLKN